jgi:cytosine/adenosine deaminase-related metal-dependent hydrolase
MNPPGQPPFPPAEHRLLALGAAVADASGVIAAPGAVLLRLAPGHLPRLLAVGPPEVVQRHPAADGARRVSRPAAVLLTGLGPRPFHPAGGFVGWIDSIRAARATATPESIAADTRRGVALVQAAGTVAVGDIAGASRPPWPRGATHVLAASGLLGRSFLEFFALAPEAVAGLAPLARATAGLVRPGGAPHGANGLFSALVQPHAPYSVSPEALREAARLLASAAATRDEPPLPLCIHLAESPDERALIQHGSGPMRSFLERLGLWNSSVAAHFGHGLSPVAHTLAALPPPAESGPPLLAVHVNDADNSDIEALAAAGASAVYCPRASEYFESQRHFGPHRYRDMLAAGIPVALGTDSIVNLPGPPPSAPAAQPAISVLDEARRLFARDRTDPKTLLAMLTTHGAAALGLPTGLFQFSGGRPPHGTAGQQAPEGRGIGGLVAVEVGQNPGGPLAGVFAGSGSVEVLSPIWGGSGG